MKQILLIILGLSLFLSADFTRDANGIVTDSTTTLQWQDDAIGIQMTWEESIAYCEALDLDGMGWRLPNINELQSIIDDSKFNPAIVNGFTQTSSNGYWSSTTYGDVNTRYAAWYVYFYPGSVHFTNKYDKYYVRCVRGGHD